MRNVIALIAVLLYFGCEAAPGEHEPNHFVDVWALEEQGLMRKTLIGTPEGERVLFKPGGVYTAAEESDPAIAQARTALGAVSMDLGAIWRSDVGFAEAEARVTEYLQSYDARATGLPLYAAQQVAALILYRARRSDFDDPQRTAAIKPYIDYLIAGNSPDIVVVNDFLRAHHETLDARYRAQAAASALAAFEAYEAAIADAEADMNCTGCIARLSLVGNSRAAAREGLTPYVR